MTSLTPERALALGRQVERILAAGGGWNARTRAAIAAFARLQDVPVETLLALAAGEDPGSEAVLGPGRSADVSGDGGLPAERPDAVPASVAPSQRQVAVGVASGVVMFVVALAASLALGWFAFSRSMPSGGRMDGSRLRGAVPQPVGADGAQDPERGEPGEPAQDVGTGATDRVAPVHAPSSVPPVPAIYPRAPGFPIDSPPAWGRSALESFAGSERELVATRDRLLPGIRVQEADRALWRQVTASFIRSWPLLEPRRRDAAVEAMVAVLARLGDPSVRSALCQDLGAELGPSEAGPQGLWKGAGAAGLLAAIDRPGEIPARAFGDGALGWLASRGTGVVDVIMQGDAAASADALDAWLRATVEAASLPALHALRDERLLGLLDALLRRGAPLDRPGTAADSAGCLLDALPWSAGAAERGRIAAAITDWCMDPAVDARALHGLTSVLATRRPSPWWDPWLVCDARADIRKREATADRYRAALASVGTAAVRADAARIRGVRAEAVARWIRVARAVRSRLPAGDDLPSRVAQVAQLLAVSESLVLLERGRAAEAEARLGQLEDDDGIAPRPEDRWLDGMEPPEVGKLIGGDGQLEDALRKAGGLQAQLGYLRRRREMPSGDLGPVDAAFLAREAFGSRSAPLRAMCQDVVFEAYARGPTVIAALAAELPAATAVPEALLLVERLAGGTVPGGAPRDRIASAVLMLLDLHARLLPAERNRVDALAREVSQAANAAAEALGGSAPGALALPETALRAWFDADVALAREALPASEIARIVAGAESRRRLSIPGPQAAVAELVGVLEVEAAILAEKQPRSRSTVQAILRSAVDGRRGAVDAIAQLECTARALVELGLERLGGGKGGQS